MDKLRSLHDAIARDVEDGMSIAMGCGLESLIPFAASYEIIRQKRKDLTLIGPISDMQFDQLIGAGCVKKSPLRGSATSRRAWDITTGAPPKRYQQWLRTWVLAVKDHHEFLSLLGQSRVEKLKPDGNLFAPTVSFNY